MSQYYQPLEVETVLYTLWKKMDDIQPTKLRIKKIKDQVLSEKRAAAIARCAIRVIAPEALDDAGLTEEAQKLRDLPADVDFNRARDAARDAADAARAAYNTARGTNYAAATPYAVATSAAYAADAVSNAAVATRAAVKFSIITVLYANITNKQRHVYHLNQMIKMCSEIK